jgi:hypothetical protein
MPIFPEVPAEALAAQKRQARIQFLTYCFIAYALFVVATSFVQHGGLASYSGLSSGSADYWARKASDGTQGCGGYITHDAILEDYGADGRVQAEKARENLMTHQ